MTEQTDLQVAIEVIQARIDSALSSLPDAAAARGNIDTCVPLSALRLVLDAAERLEPVIELGKITEQNLLIERDALQRKIDAVRHEAENFTVGEWNASGLKRLVTLLSVDSEAPALRVVEVHHADCDIEAHAESFNEGYDEAIRQMVGGTEVRETVIGRFMEVLATDDDHDGYQPHPVDAPSTRALAEQLADAVLSEADLSADTEEAGS